MTPDRPQPRVDAIGPASAPLGFLPVRQRKNGSQCGLQAVVMVLQVTSSQPPVGVLVPEQPLKRGGERRSGGSADRNPGHPRRIVSRWSNGAGNGEGEARAAIGLSNVIAQTSWNHGQPGQAWVVIHFPAYDHPAMLSRAGAAAGEQSLHAAHRRATETVVAGLRLAPVGAEQVAAHVGSNGVLKDKSSI